MAQRFLLIVFFVVFSLTGIKAGTSTHTVVKGDTLWDLSGKYYNNEWLWDNLYNANKEIINDPNLIYPEQVLVIPEKNSEIVTQTPETAPPVEEEEVSVSTITEEEPLEQEPELKTEPVYEEEPQVSEEPVTEQEPVPVVQEEFVVDREKFILPVDFKFDGKVVGDKENKILISQCDVVYINAGENKGLKPKMQGDIIRIIGRMSGARKDVYQVKKVGLIELTSEIGEDNSAAIVIRSYEPIQKGDLIKMKETD